VVCEKFAAKGCNIAINYFSRPEPAQELSEKIRKEYDVKTAVIQGDGGDLKDCKYMVHETIKEFGGIDVLIGNAVGEPPSRNLLGCFVPYEQL
jgi:NAD(P)-dependent dehydrogenase (short-subunit alcohol dehydrogenase family)